MLNLALTAVVWINTETLSESQWRRKRSRGRYQERLFILSHIGSRFRMMWSAYRARSSRYSVPFSRDLIACDEILPKCEWLPPHHSLSPLMAAKSSFRWAVLLVLTNISWAERSCKCRCFPWLFRGSSAKPAGWGYSTLTGHRGCLKAPLPSNYSHIICQRPVVTCPRVQRCGWEAALSWPAPFSLTASYTWGPLALVACLVGCGAGRGQRGLVWGTGLMQRRPGSRVCWNQSDVDSKAGGCGANTGGQLTDKAQLVALFYQCPPPEWILQGNVPVVFLEGCELNGNHWSVWTQHHQLVMILAESEKVKEKGQTETLSKRVNVELLSDMNKRGLLEK